MPLRNWPRPFGRRADARRGRTPISRTPEPVGGLVGAAQAALGPLTLLVNNASLFEPDASQTLDFGRWERHFAVNLRAPALLARDFAARCRQDVTGSIVNIVDQRVLKLTPQNFSYTLTKAALYTATDTMAQALAPRIRVNAVGPGPTARKRPPGRRRSSPRQSGGGAARAWRDAARRSPKPSSTSPAPAASPAR